MLHFHLSRLWQTVHRPWHQLSIPSIDPLIVYGMPPRHDTGGGRASPVVIFKGALFQFVPYDA